MKSLDFKYVTLFAICMIFSFVVVKPAYPEGTFKLKPGAKGQICLKCHERLKEIAKRRFVHPLVKKGDCTGCHAPHASSHKNLLTSGPRELCYNCHKEVLPENARSAHKVAVEANCNKCHDSHGSNNKFILIKSGNELCFDCHKDISDNIKNIRFKHKSLVQGKGCLNCHNPHASAKADSLLRNSIPSLCIECHKTDKSTFQRQHMNYPVAKSDCNSCHNPHGSNMRGAVYDFAHAEVAERKCDQCHQKPSSPNPLRTKKETTQLCRECHRDMVAQTFNKKRVHWPLVDNVGCLNCHSPHATKQQKLLKGPMVDVCGRCHSDTVELQEWSINNPKNERLCEPVKTGNCITCHSPHASDNVLLIKEQDITSGLCGRCHAWETHSTHPIGEKIRDPRDKNLAVGCLSCHKACGTGNKPSMLSFDTTYELCIQCHIDRRR